MERTLAWTILAIGVLGLLSAAGLAIHGSGRDGKATLPTSFPITPSFMAMALAPSILVWLATLQSTPPFAPGGGWGQGFACGSVVALLSLTIVMRALGDDAARAQSTLSTPETSSHYRIAATAPLFGAIVAVAVPLLFLRTSLVDVLSGVAMGWLAIGCSQWLGLREVAARRATLVVLMGTGFAVVLCLATMLGVYRDVAASGAVAGVARDAHAISALALGAGVPLSIFCAALVASLLPSRTQGTLSAPHGLTALFGVAMLLVLGFLLATRLLSAIRSFYCVEVGLLAGLLIALTARAASGRVELIAYDSNPKPELTQSTLEAVPIPSPLPLLVVFSAFVVSYQIWQGFGAGLMLLAAWPVAFSASLSVGETREDADRAGATSTMARDAIEQAVMAALFFAAVLLASRVFDTRFRDVLHVAFISDQHALFGLLIGALLPACAGKLGFFDTASTPSVSTLARALMTGAIVVLVSGWLVMLWGVRPLPALFAGLALGAGSGAVFGASSRFGIREVASRAWVAMGVSLLLVQWTGHVLPMAQASRGQRLEWVLWGAAFAALVVIVSAVAAHGARHWRRQKANLETRLAGEEP